MEQSLMLVSFRAAGPAVPDRTVALAARLHHPPHVSILAGLARRGTVLLSRLLGELGDHLDRFADATSGRVYAGT